MIIYGSRVYGRKNPVKGWGVCDNCGKYLQHTSYDGRRWGHLYFIPMIPLGSRIRVLKECKKCSHGMQIPENDVPLMIKDFREGTDKALASLISGQKEFDDEGTMVPCAPVIASSIELLHCLGQSDYVRLVKAALKEKKLTYADMLVAGQDMEFNGDPDKAAELYRQAAELEPEETFPLLAMGSVYINKNQNEKAREVYEKALDMEEDRMPVLSILLSVYELLKDFARLAETYEECFELAPELKDDKKIVKAYKKACKKAGREPAAVRK